LIRSDIDNFDAADFDTKAQAFKQIAESLPFHRIDRGRAVADCFALSIGREAAGRINQSFVGW
jgi:hypothetical protein